MVISREILEIPGATLVIETTEYHIQNIELSALKGKATFQFSVSDLWTMDHISGETMQEKYKRCLINKAYKTGYMPELESINQ